VCKQHTNLSIQYDIVFQKEEYFSQTWGIEVMKRLGLVLLALVFACSFAACAAPAGAADSSADVTPTAEIAVVTDDPLAGIRNAATIEEVAPYHKAALEAGDYATALVCAERMLELDPASQDALNALTEAKVALLQQQADDLKDSIANGLASAQDPTAYAEYVSRLLEGTDFSVDLPFVSDYGAAENANTSGITFSNLVQRGVYNGWQGGLLTAQADWIYYASPAEDYGIYKLRNGGADSIRLGDSCGCYLNVIGDWLYYCNTLDDNRIYKMRTDGSENQKVCEDTGRYLAVIDDWMYYVVENENFNLYRARLDGSERTMLSGDPTREAYCADGALYTALRDKGGLYRANPDGSDPAVISTRSAGCYFLYDGWLYMIVEDHGLVIMRTSPDGTGEEELLRTDGNIAAFTLANGKRVVSGRLEDGQPEGITVFDAETMEPGAFLSVWCEGLYTDTQGTVYFIDCEDNSWHWLNAETGETGNLN
jgi:hypothetical protein